MGNDRAFAAAQLAHDLADDDAQRTATCSHCKRRSDEGKRLGADGRFVCLTCIESGAVCARCGEDEPTQDRGGQRVCLECAREIDLEAEDDEPSEDSAPEPIGTCPSCGAPQYTAEGFCGGCRPERC